MLLSVAAAPVHICADRAGGSFSPPLSSIRFVAQTPLPVATLDPSGSLQAKEAAQKIEPRRFRPEQRFQRCGSVLCWDCNSEGNGLSQLPYFQRRDSQG